MNTNNSGLNYLVINNITGEHVFASTSKKDARNMAKNENKHLFTVSVLTGKVMMREWWNIDSKTFCPFEKCYASFRNGCTAVGGYVSGYCPSCDAKYNLTECQLERKLLNKPSNPFVDDDDSIYNTGYDGWDQDV